jgi:hypothetical protein
MGLCGLLVTNACNLPKNWRSFNIFSSLSVHVHIQSAENPGVDLAKLRCVRFGKRKINSQILRGHKLLFGQLIIPVESSLQKGIL